MPRLAYNRRSRSGRTARSGVSGTRRVVMRGVMRMAVESHGPTCGLGAESKRGFDFLCYRFAGGFDGFDAVHAAALGDGNIRVFQSVASERTNDTAVGCNATRLDVAHGAGQ